MKKGVPLLLILSLLSTAVAAQKRLQAAAVPVPVKAALMKAYVNATKVRWEREKENYEANWGGKTGEDHSVLISTEGKILETIDAIPISELPKPVYQWIGSHFKNSKITEAGRVVDASGKISYEVEVKKKDIIFDEAGKFIKIED